MLKFVSLDILLESLVLNSANACFINECRSYNIPLNHSPLLAISFKKCLFRPKKKDKTFIFVHSALVTKLLSAYWNTDSIVWITTVWVEEKLKYNTQLYGGWGKGVEGEGRVFVVVSKQSDIDYGVWCFASHRVLVGFSPYKHFVLRHQYSTFVGDGVRTPRI